MSRQDEIDWTAGDDGVFGENWPMTGDPVHRSQPLRPAAVAVVLFVATVGLLAFSHYVAPRIAEWIVGG